MSGRLAAGAGGGGDELHAEVHLEGGLGGSAIDAGHGFVELIEVFTIALLALIRIRRGNAGLIIELGRVHAFEVFTPLESNLISERSDFHSVLSVGFGDLGAFAREGKRDGILVALRSDDVFCFDGRVNPRFRISIDSDVFATTGPSSQTELDGKLTDVIGRAEFAGDGGL